MPFDVIEYANSEAVAKAAADIIAQRLRERPGATLGLATGKTPMPIYQHLVRMHQTGQLSFRDTTTFNLDEYVGLRCSHPASFASYMRRIFFERTDFQGSKINLLDGAASCPHAEAVRYEKLLTEHEPIDLQLLGIGQNGHIGFNEPGSAHDSRTRVVELCPSTIDANKDDLAALQIAPKHAITMGIGTILEASAILVVVTGSAKSTAVERMLNGPKAIENPASALQRHRNVTVLACSAALSKAR